MSNTKIVVDNGFPCRQIVSVEVQRRKLDSNGIPLSNEAMALLRNPETPGYVLNDKLKEDEVTGMTIYLLSGCGGPGDDYIWWAISCFLTKEAAEKYRDAVIEEKKHLNSVWLNCSPENRNKAREALGSILDPQANTHTYLGYVHDHSAYGIEEIQLKVEPI